MENILHQLFGGEYKKILNNLKEEFPNMHEDFYIRNVINTLK